MFKNGYFLQIPTVYIQKKRILSNLLNSNHIKMLEIEIDIQKQDAKE